jgi:hypothetical protein
LLYATECIDWFPNALQFPALNGVAVGNQILENVLLAFKMSGNCHFQIKWLDNSEFFKPFKFKRRVSSHFVTKTTTCCICMWKLSFLKYGNTHLISELYYKIGRRFIFRKIIMFSVPLGSSS